MLKRYLSHRGEPSGKCTRGFPYVLFKYNQSDWFSIYCFRIRIAQQRSRLAELFDNEDETRDTNFLEYEERIISWQEKIFSSFETGFYSDLKNCNTELQKIYHDEITKNNTKGSRIYTYTDKDAFYPDNHPLVNSNFKSFLSRRNPSALPVLTNRKPFCQRYNKKVVDEVPDDSRIRTNHYLYKDAKVMHVVADLSPKDKTSYDFNDSEILLCTITFDKTRNSLNVNPDFTDEEHYRIRGTDMGYDYWIEHVSKRQSDDDLGIQVKELGDVSGNTGCGQFVSYSSNIHCFDRIRKCHHMMQLELELDGLDSIITVYIPDVGDF